jgi:dihydroorotate dehydrogenase electron transfer subunit
MMWTTARVHAQQHLSGQNHRLVLHAPELAAQAVPGQFIELSTGGATLLNKPLSIAAVAPADGLLTVVYKTVGPGTRAFAHYHAGASVRVMGPCGNGFTLPDAPCYAVGGGIGIPPLYFLATRTQQPMAVVLGARSADDMVLVDEFTKCAHVTLTLTSDDGSCGIKGMVTDALTLALHAERRPVYACGPVPMLRAVARLCAEHAAPLWACLEAYMGCGMGVCMGCVVPTVRGMERVCHEGPVFRGEDVLWEQLDT